MKVSIIIPTFNRVQIIPETINAILNQTFNDFELIIIDNCSKDKTEEIIQNYIKKDTRIKYFKHPNNGVVAVNRNFGIQKATGEFFAFCDDDDLWMATKLERQIQEFQKDLHLGLICTNGMKFNQQGDLGLLNPQEKEQLLSFSSLMFSNKIISSSTVIRRRVIEDVGVFDEDSILFTVEDYDLWLRIAIKYRIKYLTQPLIKYRVHSTQATNNILNPFTLFRYHKLKIIYNKYTSSHASLVESAKRYFLTKIKITKIIHALEQKQIKRRDLLKERSIKFTEKLQLVFFSFQFSQILRPFYKIIKKGKV